MQIQNKGKVKYLQVLPDGSTKNVFAESNEVKTNLIKKPVTIIKNHQIKEPPFYRNQFQQRNFISYFELLYFLRYFLKFVLR